MHAPLSIALCAAVWLLWLRNILLYWWQSKHSTFEGLTAFRVRTFA